MTDTRARIREHVLLNPGVHFNEIGRQLDIATGQTQYHVRNLVQGEVLVREEVCGRTHYFPTDYSAWERGALALLRRETTREIVVYLLESDHATPQAIADDVGIARSTTEWHLSNLLEYDLAEKRREGRVTVELNRPAELRELLAVVEPRLADRMVDRFSRLVDDLLEE